MKKTVDLGMECGDCQQFCIGTKDSERDWKSMRFSGGWKNFVRGGILSGSWQGDTNGYLLKEIPSLNFFRL